ncbi:putative iron-regulated protein [Acidovorax sp. CF316]|uniref:ChaN family lipoprotein n=1 Tax=Acidovorax sp. CF316 TaxID=1144317 RepID=UPI00026BC359|nr:ChaN family lipoprotein [Acidovorax sp. CF316]EJE51888.1 putative iron-regulated protein [Acidovorax sp. CF316]
MARRALPLLAALALAGCAHPPAPTPPVWPARLQQVLPADVLLLGEQHDATEHQALQREAVQWLAARGALAAVVMEMAEQGSSTAGLPKGATDAEAQAALNWQDKAWPWAKYGPVVMAAVSAEVPVLGGNLPRSQMRATIGQAQWDAHLPAPALQRQYTEIRDGHCGLLPEAQIAPMARIQIARDASMAQTTTSALQPGKTVLLVAGAGHVWRSLGVPTHLGAGVAAKVVVARAGATTAARDDDADQVVVTPALPPRDACAELREQWKAAPRKP